MGCITQIFARSSIQNPPPWREIKISTSQKPAIAHEVKVAPSERKTASLSTIDRYFLSNLILGPNSSTDRPPLIRANALAMALDLQTKLPLEICVKIAEHIPAAACVEQTLALARFSAKGRDAVLAKLSAPFGCFAKSASISWETYLTDISTDTSPLRALKMDRDDFLMAAVLSERLPPLMLAAVDLPRAEALQGRLRCLGPRSFGYQHERPFCPYTSNDKEACIQNHVSTSGETLSEFDDQTFLLYGRVKPYRFSKSEHVLLIVAAENRRDAWPYPLYNERWEFLEFDRRYYRSRWLFGRGKSWKLYDTFSEGLLSIETYLGHLDRLTDPKTAPGFEQMSR